MAPAALTKDTHAHFKGEIKKAIAGVKLDHATGDVHTHLDMLYHFSSRLNDWHNRGVWNTSQMLHGLIMAPQSVV